MVCFKLIKLFFLNVASIQLRKDPEYLNLPTRPEITNAEVQSDEQLSALVGPSRGGRLGHEVVRGRVELLPPFARHRQRFVQRFRKRIRIVGVDLGETNPTETSQNLCILRTCRAKFSAI